MSRVGFEPTIPVSKRATTLFIFLYASLFLEQWKSFTRIRIVICGMSPRIFKHRPDKLERYRHSFILSNCHL
jgi:hypothetical protein